MNGTTTTTTPNSSNLNGISTHNHASKVILNVN